MNTKAVFVLCPGHSGSTLLDLLIGTNDGVFSSGEIHHFPFQLFRRKGENFTKTLDEAKDEQDVCTCLKSFSACETWKQIVSNINRKVGYDVMADPLRFDVSILKPDRHSAHRRSRPLHDLFRFRIMREFSKRGLSGEGTMFYSALTGLMRKAIGRKIENNWILFDSICKSTGSGWVVDSTKDPVRCRYLFDARPDDAAAIVLVRDIRGVANSYRKRGKNPVSTARGWMRYYEWAFKILDGSPRVPRIVVSYEDLTAKPEKVRGQVARFLGLDEPADPLEIDTTRFHMVAGNPMRYRGEIVIREDESWRDQLPRNIADRVARMKSRMEPSIADHINPRERGRGSCPRWPRRSGA